VTVTFVPVTKEHLPLLRRWMSQPHWQEWWGEPDTELGYIVAMIEGRDSTEPYLFQVDERPVGYIQVWYVKPHQVEPWTKDSPWLLELPPETVGVDLSIGEADDLAKGRGHAEIIIDPDPANTRAVRAYLKAGFRPISHLEGRFDGILLMRHETQQ
jgi:RimJ/RimL family protein N-acetyltransferase